MGRKEKTRKAQTQSHRKTEKVKYKVRNWAEYNASLVERGSIEVWISQEALANWKSVVSGPRPKGAQVAYSATAIECLLTLGAVLSLPLRQTEGFGRSVLKLLGTGLKAPNYTTLCKRRKGLKVGLAVSARRVPPATPLHILVDSTGLKVYGEGEWKVRKHGYSKRRTWRKLHFSLNENTQEIEIAVLTEVGDDDAGTGSQMLLDMAEPVEQGRGDYTCWGITGRVGDGYSVSWYGRSCRRGSWSECANRCGAEEAKDTNACQSKQATTSNS